MDLEHSSQNVNASTYLATEDNKIVQIQETVFS